MGERRSRKLVWDAEDETKHISGMREHNSWSGKDHHSSHGSGRYHEFSDSRASNSARDSRDQSGWPTWESVEEHPVEPTSHSFKNTYEAKEMGGGKRYHKNVSPGFEEMGGGKRYHKNVSPGFEEMGGGKRYHKNISPGFEEMGGGKRYHMNISPGFEEMEVHNYNRTHEYDRSHSQRYMGKGRSRSRSRTRGRSRSRSLSKGRERDRGRGRDWSRSRSESRSDGYVYTNDHRRSRSPIGDYRRQPHGWRDRRSGPEKSSQTCRDFTSGGCRKGSQCRFIHPTSISRRDSDFVEDDRVESWRSRSVYSQTPRHSYTRSGFESRNDVSDLYHGEDEQFLNRSRSRSSIPCRDFKAGICRWGDACKFSHDFASADSYGQDSRNSTFNREDFDHQRYKNEKPLCKFFAAGKCSRDNCRFSHEDPNLNNLEGRLDNFTESQSSYDKNWWNAQKWDDRTRISNTPKPTTGWCEAIGTNATSTGDLNNLEGRLDKVTESQSSYDNNWLNAPKWDDVTRIPDIPKPTIGWGEAIATNTTSTGDATNGQSDDRWGRNSKNVNKIWEVQDHASNSLDSERQPSHPRESVCYVGDTGPAKSIAVEDMPNNQEYPLLHGVQLQNEDGISNRHGFSPVLENRSLTVERNVPPASHIQQHNFGETKSNVMTSFGSSVLDEVQDTRYTNHPVLLSGQSFNQNGTSLFPGQSSASKENDRVQNMLYADLTNGHETDLKQHETHAIKHLNVPIHVEIDKKTVLSPYLESKVPQILTNLLSRMHSDQVSNAAVTNAGQQVSSLTDPVSLIQSLVNERSQTYASIDVSSSKGMLPSFSSISGSQPLVSTTHVQDNVCAVSLDQSNSMGNNREYTEAGNSSLTQGTGQNNLMQERRSSPSSIVGTGVESPKLKHPESPKQQGVVSANIEVTGDGKAMGEEGKGIHENKPSDDCEEKLEEGSANKDEKGLRLFKNSLVEFVKEILKPTWKEGRMSRDVHKTVVKKVVDKVSSTIQGEHIPKTQDKIDQYLSLSKPKITKLVQAYVERSRKADA